MTFGTLDEEFIQKLCISCTPKMQFLEFTTDQFLRVGVMQPFSFLKFQPLQPQFFIDQFLIKNRVISPCVFLQLLLFHCCCFVLLSQWLLSHHPTPPHPLLNPKIRIQIIESKNKSLPVCRFISQGNKIFSYTDSLFLMGLQTFLKRFLHCQNL